MCVNSKLKKKEWDTLYIIQICHASVGIMMECLPEGRWFSRGRSPRENHLPDIQSGYPHWHGIFDLLYRTNPILVK